MATREQLIDALRRADAAGDTQAAQRFAELIKEMSAQPQAPMTIEQQRAQALGVEAPEDPRLVSETVRPGVFKGIPGALPTVVSGIVAEPVAGLSGLMQEAVTKPVGEALGFPMATGAQTVEQTRKMLTIPPIGESAKDTLSLVGDVLAPVAEAPRAVGETVQEFGGTPLQATIAETATAAIPELFGFKAYKAAKARQVNAPTVTEAAQVTDNSIIETAKKIEPSEPGTTPTKSYMEERLAAGDADVQFLGKELRDGKVVKNKAVAEAVKQGLDKKVLRSMETANASTKATMRKMLDTLKRRRVDADYGVTNRVTDQIGTNVYKRYKQLNNLRQKAGKKVDEVAKSITKEEFDFSPEVGSLFKELREVGVNIRQKANGKFKADVKGIDKVSTSGTEAAIKAVINRINKSAKPTAGDAHSLKKLIDDAVDYGPLPTAETKLASGVEAALKRFRHNVNEALGDEFEAYASANAAFKEIREPLSEMDRVFKSILQVGGKEALEAGVGTKAARTILSNNVGRAAMLDLLKQADEVLKNNNIVFDDNLIKQAVFADELERIFGSEATTSFTGSTQRANNQALRAVFGEDVIKDVAITGIEKLRGVNEDNAIKALEAMLGDTKKATAKQ